MRPLRIALPLLSVLLTLVVVEHFLRWAGFGGGAVDLHSRMLQYDSQLGWAKTPGASVSYRWQGVRIVETSNSEGARGPEHAAESPVGRRRVLFLGDSFCEGYLVSDDEVFSAQFETMAAAEAINMGVAGYSTDQQLLLHRRIVDRYRPEQTVLLFFDNDVWFNALAVEHRSSKPRSTNSMVLVCASREFRCRRRTRTCLRPPLPVAPDRSACSGCLRLRLVV